MSLILSACQLLCGCVEELAARTRQRIPAPDPGQSLDGLLLAHSIYSRLCICPMLRIDVSPNAAH